MKIAFGGDHAGYLYKTDLIKSISSDKIITKDYGPDSDDSVDYPDYAHQVANAVQKGDCDLGVLICGSGNGVAMTANKHEGIRAALCWNTELASLARQHNDSNIICIPARFVSYKIALDMVNEFIKTAFEGGRHLRRVGKIGC